MNNYIKHLKEDQFYPCLIYFLMKNPNFKKRFTLAEHKHDAKMKFLEANIKHDYIIKVIT